MSSPAPPGVTKSPEAAAGLLWRVFIVLAPFALGYYLSTLVRSINAVIAPALTGEIGLTPGQLGLLTATYFVCFALFQLPLGVLLDRFGPRRVQSALLLVAALGTVIFALGRDVIVLTIGRGLIGVGMAGALMASITAIVRWFPAERLSLVNGTFLVIGGLGVLTATEPVEFAVAAFGWRHLFFGLAAGMALASLLIFSIVPHDPERAASTTWRRQIGELGLIYRSAYFWRLAPACGFQFAAFFGIMGLWTPFWLADVDGLPREQVLAIMFRMAVAFTIGTFLIGWAGDWLGRRRISLGRVMGWGFLMFLGVEVALILRVELPAGWIWIVIAALGNLTALAFALIARQFPKELSGRSLSALNIASLGAVFIVQWLIGVVIGLWPKNAAGAYPPEAYVAAFSVLLALNALSMALYFLPRRGSPAN